MSEHQYPRRTQHYPTRQKLLGTLPTTFSAPSSCLTPLINLSLSHRGIRYAVTCSDNSLDFATSCYPTKWASAMKSGYYDPGYGITVPFYYPASACPPGLTPACTHRNYHDTSQLSSSWNSYDELLQVLQTSQTAIGCCARSVFSCLSWSCSRG